MLVDALVVDDLFVFVRALSRWPSKYSAIRKACCPTAFHLSLGCLFRLCPTHHILNDFLPVGPLSFIIVSVQFMFRNRHTTSLDINRSRRPGPITSAAESTVGKRSRGNDGNMYVVKMDSRGIKRWAKSAKPKKTLRKTSRK